MNIRLLNRFLDDTALLLGSTADVLLQELFSPRMAEGSFEKMVKEDRKPQMTISNGVAHVPIEGIIAYRPDAWEMMLYGIEDARNIMSMIQDSRLSKDAKSVQFNVDSPGGFANGGFEIADAVAALSKIKPTVAHIGGTGASLSYMIASQAGHVMANRSARVGSIGAYSTNVDRNRMIENAGVKVDVFTNKEATFKAMGIPGKPLEAQHREHLQQGIQATFDEFKAQVLSARPGIPDSAMRGQVFTGREALKHGLVDSVGDSATATMYLKGRMG